MVTDDGTSRLIKWHWKSKQGKASFLWEEAQVLNGKNADFHRLDLWNAIASGNGPEWDLAVQIVDENQAEAFGFDMLDPTKILPEELAPLQVLGTMKLDGNPTNYFAEVEQVMFQPGHIVRGIDFTEDPLLQGKQPKLRHHARLKADIRQVGSFLTLTPSSTVMATPISSSFPSTGHGHE